MADIGMAIHYQDEGNNSLATGVRLPLPALANSAETFLFLLPRSFHNK
jgi:hypothetical protein